MGGGCLYSGIKQDPGPSFRVLRAGVDGGPSRIVWEFLFFFLFDAEGVPKSVLVMM